MYITTPALKAVALDAVTGREIWVFDPAKYNNGEIVRLRNRGVTYWKGTAGERIFPFRARTASMRWTRSPAR
jgi:quinoprotein glucose dehydrogenase